MEHIKTAQGTKIDVKSCGNVNSTLYINCMNSSFAELASIFSDKNETRIIRHYYGEDIFVDQFDGYTKLFELIENEEGIRVTMWKE